MYVGSSMVLKALTGEYLNKKLCSVNLTQNPANVNVAGLV
jgi:hypothetical protein